MKAADPAISIESVNKERIESELPKLLAELPAWRRDKALSYRLKRDQYLCAKGFCVICDMIRENFGVMDLPRFSYGKNGKPYLKEYPRIHFNMSHCPSGIACGVHSNPLGIDIEEICFHDDIARAVFSKNEMETLKKSDSKDIAFAVIWTKKESYLKLTGQGIVDDMSAVDTNMIRDVEIDTCINEKEGFVTSIATWKL